MEPFELYHHYSQNLLIAQHDVSNIIKHPQTLGEVREDFIIQYLVKSINDCEKYIKRGFINLGEVDQSGQADILLIRQFAEKIDIGSRDNVIINPDDCLMVIEVKSTLTGTYLNDFNSEAKRIKEVNPDIVCGMLAYKSDLEMNTIMKRFGYDYSQDTKSYFDVKEKHFQLPTYYPYVDFILLLDKVETDEQNEDLEIVGCNQLFLRKSTDIGSRYFQGNDRPVIRNLVALVRSLLKRI
jgi:hypothetical protein